MPTPPRLHAPPSIRALYRSLSVQSLLVLQEAFLLDVAEVPSPTCQAFCEQRMRLIQALLKEKAALKAAREAKRAAKKRLAIPEN